jgi:hypothetical protein
VPIERPQIDVAGGAAGRTACPQEPIAGRNGGANCRRKQHRHPLRLALVPHRDQVVGILKDLPSKAEIRLQRNIGSFGPGSDMRSNLHLISARANPLELLERNSGA